MTADTDMPFWQHPLEELGDAQWEQLCDGCARCCLHKLEDEDTGEVFYTRIACAQLDVSTCRCSSYACRVQVEPECMVITRENIATLDYLPETCAYRLRQQGKPLPPWHPLLSGDSRSIHVAGISVQAYAMPLTQVPDPDDLEDYIIDLS